MSDIESTKLDPNTLQSLIDLWKLKSRGLEEEIRQLNIRLNRLEIENRMLAQEAGLKRYETADAVMASIKEGKQ